MSALPPPESDIKCDIMECPLWANSGHWPRLFDHLIGARKERWRHGETKCLGGLQVNYQFEFGRGLHREASGLLPFKNAIDITGSLPVGSNRIRHITDRALIVSIY